MDSRPSREDPLFRLSRYVRHRPWCPEANGPGDCTCGLYALLDSIQCTCGHKVSVHTDRDVDDVVGWPCSDCKSKRCRGFAALPPEPPSDPTTGAGLLGLLIAALSGAFVTALIFLLILVPR